MSSIWLPGLDGNRSNRLGATAVSAAVAGDIEARNVIAMASDAEDAINLIMGYRLGLNR